MSGFGRDGPHRKPVKISTTGALPLTMAGKAGAQEKKPFWGV
jgi:hypothetical protein